VSKLSGLLHEEIKPSDVPINGRLDWWVCYLDERPPREMLCLTTVTKTGRMQQRWKSRSTHSHNDDMTHQTNPKEIMQPDLAMDWRQNKKYPPSLLQTTICDVRRTMQGYTGTDNDCDSLKNSHERSGKCPCGFLKTHWKPSGTDLLIVIPSSSSCPSFWGGSSYVGTLTLNTAWRCLHGTLIMLVIR